MDGEQQIDKRGRSPAVAVTGWFLFAATTVMRRENRQPSSRPWVRFVLHSCKGLEIDTRESPTLKRVSL